jgi:hypothetical protein
MTSSPGLWPTSEEVLMGTGTTSGERFRNW